MNRLSPEIESFFAKAQADVESALRSIIKPAGEPIPNLDDGMAYSLGLDEGATNAGKRIRPLLCLLVCHSLGGDSRPALPFATAIELMHNFCLVHDDIEDGDEFRRGRPAVWKKYGLPHGINIGDYLFTKIFQALLMDEFQSPPQRTVRMFELMRSTLDHTHRGQALDMNARTGRISVSEYMNLVTEKTGHYLAAPLIAGAIAADAEPEQATALGTFGLMIGPLFQIRDDVIDLTHGKGRDSIGSDVKEGKRSFLVAYVLETGPQPLQEELLAILDKPREQTSEADVQRALEIFQQTGALEAADTRCNELQAHAHSALQLLPERLQKDLWQVTEFLTKRTV